MAGKRTREREPSRIIYEVEGIVCLAVGAVLALSFVSYVPDAPTSNHVGPFGYWIANLLIQCFGLAAYLFPLVFGAGAVALFAQRSGMASPVRAVGATALLLEASVLLGLYRTEVSPDRAGGWIGGFIATLMQDAMGLVGSTVVLAAIGLLVCIMLTGRPLSDVVAAAVAALVTAAGRVASASLDGIKRVAAAAWERRPSLDITFDTLRRARRPAPLAAIQAEAPVVFGGDDVGANVDVEPERVAPIVQIAAPKNGKRTRKERKDESREEQEEFTFALDHDYRLPPVRLLGKKDEKIDGADEKTLVAQSKILEQKLATFGVSGRVVAVRPGPVITTFEFEPDAGIKVSRVVNLSDDLTMALRAHSVRIVAPIPGKNVVGIEVSNRNRAIVGLRDLIENDEFQKSASPLTLAVGRDTTGAPVYADLAKMPHLLMAGATGTGKSVSLNAMVVSMLYKSTPHDVRFIMIDPKMLEMALYEGIPQLLVPVVTDVKKASAALKNVMREMDRRFELMKDMQVRSISDYNRKVAELEDEEWEEEEGEEEWVEDEGGEEEEYELAEDEEWEEEEEDDEAEGEEEEGYTHEHLPRIVVIVDELADLMMTVGREVEESITRLAQKARAAGIHLILATQRPSVDVITGLIKANFPSRISFKVTSRPDSRTILDNIGAERLLGNGDMLYMAPGTSFVQRLHGGLISDQEISDVVQYLKKQGGPDYKMELLESPSKDSGGDEQEEFFDELYDRAVEIVLENGQGSTSWLQRKLGIGYNRAARIMEHMEREGVVGPADGARPRKVIVGSAAMS